MCIDKEYFRAEIEILLRQAIVILQEKDKIFLDPDFDINERSVTHRLGIYLAPLFIGLDVDCEYNRTFDEDAKEYLAKKVDFSSMEAGLTLYDTEAKTVYPDIIVHKRNTSYNLLAIEVKMGWKNSKGEFDWLKAVAYRTILGYLHSACVVLGPGDNIDINWV